MVDFGTELSYDSVLEVLLNADDRIKNIILEDFDNHAYFIKLKNNESKEESEKWEELPLYNASSEYCKEVMKTIIAKNVLAGRVCLFKFDDTFTYKYGQSKREQKDTITSITTEVKIPLNTSTSQSSEYTETSNIYFNEDFGNLYVSIEN